MVKNSKSAMDLGNVMRQLKSGKPRGSNPRDLYSEEVAALEQKRDALQTAIKMKAREQGIARVNSHTTAEADRVIQTVEESTRDSK